MKSGYLQICLAASGSLALVTLVAPALRSIIAGIGMLPSAIASGHFPLPI